MIYNIFIFDETGLDIPAWLKEMPQTLEGMRDAAMELDRIYEQFMERVVTCEVGEHFGYHDEKYCLFYFKDSKHQEIGEFSEIVFGDGDLMYKWVKQSGVEVLDHR